MTSKKRLLSMILILVMMFSLFSSASIPPAAAQGIEEEEVGPELPETPEPTPEPAVEPTPDPAIELTPEPTEEPAIELTPEPEPTTEPIPEPTAEPTPEPMPDMKHITETGTAYAPVTIVGAGTVTGYEEISGYQVTIDNAWSNTNTATSPTYQFRFGERGSPNLPAITCHAVKKDGVTTPVFCVQPNKAANDDSPHTMYDDLSSFAVWSTMTANQKQLLKLALACGYPNTTDSSISANDQWAAMQTMVFDIIVGFVRYDGSSIIKAAKSSGGANFIDEDWAGREVQGAAWTSITDGLQGNPTGVKTAYNNILSRMQNARLSAVGQPDFGLITLNYDAASGSYKGTATASNGNAAYYNFAYNSGGVTVTQSGNTVTVTMTPAAAANYTSAKYLPEVNSTVGYYTISDGKYCGYSSTSSSTSYQSFLGINGTNPINYSKAKLQVKANIANGSITINKTSSNPSVSDNNSNYKYNAKYGVYSDAACTALVKEVTLTSGTNKGTAKVTGLALGTYYVKEISAPAGFQINATASVGITLTAANTDATANMTDEPLTGSLTIIKTSSDPSLTDGRSAYQYNAVYGVYSNAACTAEVTRVTLNSETNQGKATVNDLPFGTYYVKEITAPTGFELNPTPSAAVTVSESTASSAVSFGTANVERGTLNDATGALGSSNEKRLRTRNFITLEPGTYYISNEQGWWLAYYLYSADSAHSYYKDESHYSWIKGSEVLLTLSEPRCIKLVWRNAAETTLNPADITGEEILKNVVTVSMTDPPITMPFTLQKRSANTDMTDGNSCYSLEGAQYGVYARASDANADRNRVEILTTDADGNATSSQSYALGTWYVKELVASPGYRLDMQVHEVVVTVEEADNVFTVTEEPGKDPNRIQIQKISSSGAVVRTITSGYALFKVEFYGNQDWSDSPLRTWYYKTFNGIADLGDAAFLDPSRVNSNLWYDDGLVTYPLGTIKITEEQAPAGYIRTDLVWLAQVTQDSPGAKGTWHWVTPEGGLVSYTADGPTLENEHRNGTLEVLKLDHLGNALPGVTFRLEYSTDGGTTWAKTYRIEPDALTDYGACKSADLVDGELTTGADGKAVFEGLMADGEILYRLTEVKAPAGFTLLKDPVYEGTLPVPVDRDDLPDSEVIDGQAYSYTLTCRVTDTSQFVLPVSGGSGFVFLPLAMATAALGMALILTDGRRKSRE